MRITIKAARINKGLRQTDVAAELNVARETVSSWEKGKTKPSLKMVEPLCRLYGVSYDDIAWSN